MGRVRGARNGDDATMAAIHALPDPRHLARPPVSGPAAVVWLFDVDGTLLLTDGAGRDAMAHALLEVFGVADDLRDVPFAGRTDPLIVADALRKHALAFRDGTFDRFARNVRALPRARDAVIIRSYFPNRRPHPQQVPGYNTVQVVQTMASFLEAQAGGGYASYYELVTRDVLELRRPAGAPR